MSMTNFIYFYLIGRRSDMTKKPVRTKSVRRLGNFIVSNENITESVCLEDSSTYHFVIKDTFGNGRF